MGDDNGFADRPIDLNKERVSREREQAIHENPRLQFMIDLKQNNMTYMKAVAWKGFSHFNTGPSFFRKSGRLVELVRDKDDGTSLREVDSARLTDVVSSSTFWFRVDRNFETIEKLPLPPVISSMIADPYPPTPHITRIVASPVYGAGGELMTTPGYNPTTHTYFDKNPHLELPGVSQEPSVDELADAVGLIGDELLGEFRFVDESDRANAIALLLNPFVRDMIPGQTPLHVITSPKRGSGKTLLASVCMIPALGSPGWVIPPTSNEEEMRKRLTGIALAGPESVCIDNVNGRIGGESLASVITSGQMYDRILGESRFETLRFRNTWMATVNNPTVDDDFSRRMIQIRIDAKSENPESIEYENIDIEAWANHNRGRLIWSALTMVNYWIAQGMTPGTQTFNSFNHWARVHGGILDACSIPGFLANRHDKSAIETDQGAMREFLFNWYTKPGVPNDGVKASSLIELAESVEGFPWVGKSPDNKVRMGHTLKRFRDQVFGEFSFSIDTSAFLNSNRWKIVRLSD